jgi:hypothetical protein
VSRTLGEAASSINVFKPDLLKFRITEMPQGTSGPRGDNAAVANFSLLSAQSHPWPGRRLLTQMGKTPLEELGDVVAFECISFHDGHQQRRTSARSHLITNAIDYFPLDHG